MRLAALLAIALTAQAATLLVLNKEDATLAIVDPASGKVLATIPTGEGPHEVATDGKLAFVGNYGAQNPGHTLSVIDIGAKKELRRVELNPLWRPHGIFAFQGKAYFTAETNRMIARYDPAANQLDWMFGTGLNTTHMILLNKAGTKIFTSNIGSDAIRSEQDDRPLRSRREPARLDVRHRSQHHSHDPAEQSGNENLHLQHRFRCDRDHGSRQQPHRLERDRHPRR